jgi:hypothetical protein
MADAAGGRAKLGPERRMTFARVGTRSCCRRLMMLAQKRATTSRPWYSRGIGGMETLTSAVSKATSASTSPDCHARTNFSTSACSACEPGAGGGSRSLIGGRRRCRVARARFRALWTDSTVDSSMSATSLAWYPRTSRNPEPRRGVRIPTTRHWHLGVCHQPGTAQGKQR